MKWIDAIWQPAQPIPRRIFVAGCGTGLEAFALCRRFPSAQIVAVDFCARSIAVARKLQRKAPQFRQIQFAEGDLTSPKLVKTTGRDFDFISCHGVLSYIPQPERVLQNFAHFLHPHGVLYLGVNGLAHFSSSWRSALPGFGFDVMGFEDGRRLRRVLKLFEAVAEYPVGCIANKNAAYLASDLFGPLIRNLSLSDWIGLCSRSALNFLSSYPAQRALRLVLNNDAGPLLLPRSRAEACELVEILRPSGFHALLFSPRPVENPPWEKARELLRWRVLRTELYGSYSVKRRGPWRALRTVKLKSASINSLVELRAPEWQLEILRQSDGKRSLGEILTRIPIAIASKALCASLYLLYQLAVINLRSPLRLAPRGVDARGEING